MKPTLCNLPAVIMRAVAFLLVLALAGPMTGCRKEDATEPDRQQSDDNGSSSGSSSGSGSSITDKRPQFGKTVSINYTKTPRSLKYDRLIVKFSIEKSRYGVSEVKVKYKNMKINHLPIIVTAKSAGGTNYTAEFNTLPKVSGDRVQFTLELTAKNSYRTTTMNRTYDLQ